MSTPLILTSSPADPTPLFTPKYFLGLAGDYSSSDRDVSTLASPSRSRSQSQSPSPPQEFAMPTLGIKARKDNTKHAEKEKERIKGGEVKMNRAARREGKRRAWAEAHAHALDNPNSNQETPTVIPTPVTIDPLPTVTTTTQPKPKPKPKPNYFHLPLRIQHLLLPLPAPSPLARSRVRHRYFSKVHLANLRDLLLGRRRVLPDAVISVVEAEVQVDLDGVLRERLRGLLLARRSGKSTPVMVGEKVVEKKEDDDLEAVEEHLTFFEKPVPFFKQRPRSPTTSNPIIYPRGHIPSRHQNSKLHRDGETEIEVEIEIIKPKYKPLLTAQTMLKKVVAHPGCMYGLGERERKWLRRMITGKVEAEEELERVLRGSEGEVVWEEGVGRVEEGGERDNERVEGCEDGNVHVFMDHSNIHLTMLNTVSPRHSSPSRHSDTETDSHTQRPFQPFTKKYLSLPLLTLLLTRGRSVSPNALHLVASAPLMQNLDQAVKNGWKCAVLQRVEVAKEKGGARKFVREDLLRKRKMLVEQDREKGNVASDTENLATSGGETDTGKKHSMKTAKSEDEQEKVALPSLDDPTITSRRMREQAVDELLQLKMLQTILVTPSAKIGTIVLCTGDAAPGQFNDLGFLGCTKLAIERGWRVELWSWKKGLSRLWREEAKGSRWSRRQFEIMYLDDWVAEVVEEKAE